MNILEIKCFEMYEMKMKNYGFNRCTIYCAALIHNNTYMFDITIVFFCVLYRLVKRVNWIHRHLNNIIIIM